MGGGNVHRLIFPRSHFSRSHFDLLRTFPRNSHWV
jgi:hypothetical protein